MDDSVDDRYTSLVILDSPQQISAARRSYERPLPENGTEDDDLDFSFATTADLSTPAARRSYERPLPENDAEDDNINFSFATTADLSTPAHHIFSGGRILPVFNPTLPAASEQTRGPLWKLMMDPPSARSLSSSSSLSSEYSYDLEAEGEYCIWPPPPPEMRRKSSSTGSSSSRRCRLSLFLGRCRSLGSDSFAFPHVGSGDENPNLNPNPKPTPASAEEEKGGGKGLKLGKPAGLDMVTAHRLYYAKGGSQRVTGNRRSFVPYKPIGLLSNISGRFRSRLTV